ncbi:MAG TPA: hypothetical protein VGK29_22735 [Paludibaculum sp.]|jgi:hypothetical protein
MTPILIEKCEASVPRRGQQQERKRLQDEFRNSHPEAAVALEGQPFYVDPDGPYGSDDWLRIEFEWIEEPNFAVQCGHSFFPLHLSGMLQMFACGPVKRYSKEDFPTCEFSYPLTASFALALLQQIGILPPDAVLANETDVPVCCEEDQAA